MQRVLLLLFGLLMLLSVVRGGKGGGVFPVEPVDRARISGALQAKWTKGDAECVGDELHELTIYFHTFNRDELLAHSLAVSDPTNARYGKYLSREQVAAITGASDAQLHAVTSWLRSRGLADSEMEVLLSREAMVVRSTCGKIGKAFETKLFRQTHVENERVKIIRSVNGHPDDFVPVDLAAIVHSIRGLGDYPVPLKHKGIGSKKKLLAAQINNNKQNNKQNNNNEVGPNPMNWMFVWQSISNGGQMTVITDVTNATMNTPFPPGMFMLSVEQYGLVNNLTINSSMMTVAVMSGSQTLTGVTTVRINSISNYVKTNLTLHFTPANSTTAALVQFMNLRGGRSNMGSAYPSVMTTPHFLRDQYSLPSNIKGDGSILQAVMGFGDQFFSHDDLNLAYSNFGLDINDLNVSVWGLNLDNFTGGEAQLDIQYISTVSTNVPSVFWSVQPPSAFLMEWLADANNRSLLPDVISISYGLPTACFIDPTFQNDSNSCMGSLPSDYLQQLEDGFAKLTARGVTVTVASGDDGVNDASGDPVFCPPQSTKFHTDYPGTSVWVTGVGSTLFTTEYQPGCSEADYFCGGYLSEVACTQDLVADAYFDSGGGFNPYLPMPSYQTAFNLFDRYNKSLFNYPGGPDNYEAIKNLIVPTGRGVPDVAVVGHQFIIIDGGAPQVTGGTSASSPSFAGMIALMNVARKQAGLPTLGFLNPLLYQLAASNSKVFNDVMRGENKCGRGDSTTCCKNGLLSVQGWDPVTGLGSINFAEFMDAVVSSAPAPAPSTAANSGTDSWVKAVAIVALIVAIVLGIAVLLLCRRRESSSSSSSNTDASALLYKQQINE